MWVFGIVDTSHIPALWYMELVQTRNAATLLLNIQRHVAPGAVVHSNQWRTYSQVALHLLQLTTPSITPSILWTLLLESIPNMWSHSGISKLKHMRGCHLLQLPGYLDEFETGTLPNLTLFSSSLRVHI